MGSRQPNANIKGSPPFQTRSTAHSRTGRKRKCSQALSSPPATAPDADACSTSPGHPPPKRFSNPQDAVQPPLLFGQQKPPYAVMEHVYVAPAASWLAPQTPMVCGDGGSELDSSRESYYGQVHLYSMPPWSTQQYLHVSPPTQGLSYVGWPPQGAYSPRPLSGCSRGIWTRSSPLGASSDSLLNTPNQFPVERHTFSSNSCWTTTGNSSAPGSQDTLLSAAPVWGYCPAGGCQDYSLPADLQLPLFLQTLGVPLSGALEELREFLQVNDDKLAYNHIRSILHRLVRMRHHVRGLGGNVEVSHIYEKLTSCMDLVLAVLLLRKLMDMKLLKRNGKPMDFIQADKPESIMFTTLRKLYSKLKIYNFLIESVELHIKGLFALIAAVTIGEMELVNEDIKNQILVLRKVAWEGQGTLCNPLILIAAISGDLPSLCDLLVIFRDHIAMENDCIPAVCCQLTMWAHIFGTNNIERVMTALRSCYESTLMRVPRPSLFFLGGIREVIDYFGPSLYHYKPCDGPAALFAKYASFVFNSNIIASRSIQEMLLDCISQFNRDIFDKENFLPQSIFSLCLGTFQDLCQRGGAGCFLLLLQFEHFRDFVPASHIERLILYLVQATRVTQRRYPLLNSCELCSQPIASFLLWMLSCPSLPDSFPDPREVAGYCVDHCLPLFWKLREPRDVVLCAYHRHGLQGADPAFMGNVIETCEKYQRNRSLQLLAVLSVLQDLDGDCGRLESMDIPDGPKKYFHLDYPGCVARGEER